MTAATGVRVDIGAVLDQGRWTGSQKRLTMLAATAVLFDGFDIQILGLAIPSIMREWGLARAAFAPVLVIGLAGMVLGSPLAGYLGDRFGRRTALIGSVLLFGAATVATAFVHGLAVLAVLRFLTGVGAGGALPNATAMAAEFAPLRNRPTAVTFTIVCVPLGGMVGGLAASQILPMWGWRALYLVGGGAPLMVAAVLWRMLPESPRFLARHPARWGELARLVQRLGHEVAAGAQFEDARERSSPEPHSALRSLVSAPYLRDTIGLWIAFFSCLSAVYLAFSWLPAMLAAQGLDVGTASAGLAAYNFGGVLSVPLWAALVSAKGSRGPLMLGSLAGAASALALYFADFAPGGNHTAVIAGFGLHGLFVNSVQCSLFALCAHVYPTQARASGIAAAAGIGRIGAMGVSFIGAGIIQAGRGAYLKALAAAMIGAAIGVAVVAKHFRAGEGRAQ
jgi:AAHS family 4-hydroxybenzoate transporter-like MFS transporter